MLIKLKADPLKWDTECFQLFVHDFGSNKCRRHLYVLHIQEKKNCQQINWKKISMILAIKNKKKR